MRSLDPLPKIIGHRGAAAVAPENTLISLQYAHDHGAEWVEFDVKLTADGVPILMHDDRLGRTTNGRGHVAKTSMDVISKLDAGGWFSPEFAGEPVPTLEGALKLAANLGLGINVELKPCRGRAEETANVVAAVLSEFWSDDLPQPLISSFDRKSLEAMHAVRPELALGFLCTRVPRNWASMIEQFGCQTLNVSNRWVRKRHIEAAQAAGIPLLIYTVNDPDRAKRLIEAGVTSVFSDNVQGLAAILSDRVNAA